MTIADAVSNREGARDDEKSAAASPGLSPDDVFHILQTKRRRDVLRYLRGASEPVRLRDLAEQVAAWEQGTTIRALSSDERQRVYISLYQSHLPKLDEEGIVEYDKDRGLVERTPLAATFDPYIDEVVGTTPTTGRNPWPGRYALGVGAGVALLVIATLDVVSLPSVLAGALALTAIGAITVAHAVSIDDGSTD